MRCAVALLALLLLPACAIKPVHYTSSCDFKRSVIDVDTPVSAQETANASAAQRSEDVVFDALRLAGAAPAASDGRPIEPAMLFLSGGGQHGAFGAGFLSGWQKREGHLPKFAVVTGISTGSILSTFAFVDRPDIATEAYSIRTEGQLLKPLVAWKNGAPTVRGYIDLVRKGAVADLKPLRGFINSALTDEILASVARGGREGRVLRVGVVNVDTNQAVSIDLTDMALRWAGASEADKPRFRGCYVEAIVASSSAPLAALPVFIDNRDYIDGGARFGAFADELERVAEIGREPDNLVDGKPLVPRIYLLINGDQRLPSRCGRADETECDPPRTAQNKGTPLGDPPELRPVGRHADWEFLKLALRSEGILANQVYRFSADSIAYLAKREGMLLFYAQIDPDMPAHPFALDDAVLGRETLTCAQARDKDRDLLDPVQFYPRYMRCLVDYGTARGLAGWKPKEHP